MQPGSTLYFIALLPDSIIQEEVTAYKQTAHARFGSGHALKSPPHVTLVPPFRTERTAFSAIQAVADEQVAFPVDLRNFDRFGHRVIFVDVVPRPDLLACQQRLTVFCANQFGIPPDTRPFHPHMTVAFKDLKRTAFPDAWAYFSTQVYERTFTANAFTLLAHTGQHWTIEQTFPFR